MRAAVIGYNIFAVGGTTQSNLNLLTTLNQHYTSTVYFNYLPFNATDIHQLKRRHHGLAKTQFALIKDVFEQERQSVGPYDVIWITREDLFPLSTIFRNANPQALIIGEVHTPLALLDDNLPGLNDLSCVRVATPSIKDEFEERYNFKRIYVQTVGLDHLKWGKIDDQLSPNFVVQSRFFEKQKDIMYSLRLINDLKQHGKTNFHLYIQGTGADEFDYRSYIDGNHLRSIAETVAQGHQVLAYLGDDDVIYENFKDVPMVYWIEKHSLAEDADKMIAISQHAVTTDEFEQSQAALKAMAADYYSKFVDRIRQFEDLEFNLQPLTDKDKLQIQQTIENKLGPLNPGLTRRIYYRIIKAPIFKKIFGLRFFQRVKKKVK